MSEGKPKRNWTSLVAVMTSVTALAISSYTNFLTRSEKEARETPFVIPNIEAREGTFKITLENYSEIAANIKIIEIGQGDKIVPLYIGAHNETKVDGGDQQQKIIKFARGFFFERHGVEIKPGVDVGVTLDYALPPFIRVRQDKPFLSMTGLENIFPLLPENMDENSYRQSLLKDLYLMVCSCNIYGDSCYTVGNGRSERVKSCSISENIK